jgi:anti-sigma regulatory factor (Ser/Thr protein kinase)
MAGADSTILLEKTYTLQGGDFIRAGEISSSIKKILKEIGIDSQIIRRMAIASFEAEINVVCYAERGTFNLTITPDTLKVVVQDVGQGIADIELAMKEGYSTATEQIREMGFGAGMGLPNIKKNVDRLAIDSLVGKGTRIEMVIDMKNLNQQDDNLNG